MHNFPRFIILPIIILGLFTPRAVAQNDAGTKNKKIAIYTTSDSLSLRFSRTEVRFEKGSQPVETQISIFVEPAKSFQTFLGIGGAITDASAEVFSKLSKQKQKDFLDAYYSRDNGIGYSLMRTTIHSSDFSSGSYTYVANNDTQLKTFNISHDMKFRVPMIKRILAINNEIPIYASPWSPPAFMKDNNNMLRGGKLLPEFRQSWANYFVKFVNAYQKEGIPLWGISVQNEPMAVQTWESCIFTAEEERDFLKDYLGPTMEKAGLGDKKIIVWDHNRDLMNHRANVIFSDPEAAKYAWGMGFHWYETWTGGDPLFDNVQKVQEAYPNKNLIFTEGCIEKFDTKRYYYWPNAERYGTQMINDFNNGTVAWTDWNILLDEKGGPNHAGNFCFAPVHADLSTGELIFTPSYYYIGHFSKFVLPNAKRISTVSSRSALLSTSFKNNDGTVATVVLNKSDKAVTYNIFVNTESAAITIPPHAIQTLVY
jgi:glucosylceramidase